MSQFDLNKLNIVFGILVMINSIIIFMLKFDTQEEKLFALYYICANLFFLVSQINDSITLENLSHSAIIFKMSESGFTIGISWSLIMFIGLSANKLELILTLIIGINNLLILILSMLKTFCYQQYIIDKYNSRLIV